MKYGDKGKAVRELQERLLELGYELPMYGADGVLGDEVWDALREFSDDIGDSDWAPEVPPDVLQALYAPTLEESTSVESPGAARARPPAGAVHEATLTDGVVLYDASGLLPLHKSKRWRTRDVNGIVRCYVHHSGAPDVRKHTPRSGFAGLEASARYSVDYGGKGDGWPSTPYQYWLSYVADETAQGELVVYRANPDILRTFHTGGPSNTHGISVCFQGNLTHAPPSGDQLAMADALIPWLMDRHSLVPGDGPDRGLSFHSESAEWGGSGKPTCPGPFVENYIKTIRKLATAR